MVTGTNAELEPVYALLGRVTEGLEVAHAIDAVESDMQDAPIRPILIKKITIAVS